MRTLLIVAGKSTRFWPLRDKNLWRIAGKTLLEHQVGRLRAGGCSDIVLVGGAHNLEALSLLFPDCKVIEQTDLSLGMLGALLSALPYCGAEPVLIASGNDVVEPSAYASLLKRFKKSKADGLLLARKVERYFPGGYLTVDDNRICGIVEKPGAGNEPSDLVNLVAHVHRNAAVLFDALSRTPPGKDDGYEVTINALCKEAVYEAVPYEGLWQAVKYPWHLLALLPVLLSGLQKKKISRKADVHRSAVVEGAVVLQDGVRILPHASVIGPCFIGKGTVIGNNALIRASSIGERCVIGYNTEVVRSILGSDVWTHSSYVGDSVISNNVSLGAGTTTGNLRLDEAEIDSSVKGETVATGLDKFGTAIGEGARTGIHTCISPGVKIGERSFIGSNALIAADVPDDSFVKTSTTLDIRPNTKAAPHPSGREKFKRKI